jgi:hypothetical protein
MDIVLRNVIVTHWWIFIDDLIVFSNTAEEHAQRLEVILRRLDEANLQLHPGKCEIAQPELRYLGCVVRKWCLRLPDKVTAARQYPVLKNVKDVRAFLGLASFYRSLVPNFTEIAKPLTALRRTVSSHGARNSNRLSRV